jgi:type IV secretory pathway TraG/TraD family ATPase VirD4
VREKGGRVIFLEYDLAIGETLTPIYRLLTDQALKEALSRNRDRGKVYLMADEFKLLPKLKHIDDALNFGRGLGVRVFAGIQSIDQLYDVYGEDKGNVIASGFGSIFAYHTNDSSSREYITKRFGKNIVEYGYTNSVSGVYIDKDREGNTVEDWEQMELDLGQAVIGLGYNTPFIFQFDEYRE